MDLRWTRQFSRREAQVAHPSHFMYPRLGDHPMRLINACFVLMTVGDVLLVVLLATLLISDRVRRRNATLINLLVVTIVCSIPPALLYFAQQILNPNPPHALCYTQAILKHGTDPMFVVASLALVIEFLQGTGVTILKFVSRRQLRVPLLVTLPYITFVIFATITAVLGGLYRKSVKHKKSQIFCTVDFPALTHGVEIFSVIIVSAIAVLKVIVILRLRKSWKDVKMGKPLSGKAPTSFGISQAFRILGFSILQANYIILCGIDFYFVSTATHIIPIVYEAFMPLGTFLIFGTTQDCMRVWMFWRRDPPEASEVLPTANNPSGRRVIESYLSPTPEERPPPPVPPKDSLPMYRRVSLNEDDYEATVLVAPTTAKSHAGQTTAVHHQETSYLNELDKSANENDEPSSARAVRYLELRSSPPEGFSIDWNSH